MANKTHSAAFKRKIALEAIRENRTINEIASRNELHPVQVSRWKKQLLDGALSLFESQRGARKARKIQETDHSELQQIIGKLTIELEWLKKKFNAVYE
jgi:transposase-like protein